MSIHRRAVKWEHGEIPETLLNLAREFGSKATSWNALARAGRGGYKHVGLELEVVSGGEPAEDVAGAILAMVSEYSTHNGVAVFRIDAYDESGARLGDVVLRIDVDGQADEIEHSPAGGGARWALKALDETHTRHMKTLDVIPVMVEMVGQCLEAMAGAIASAAQSKMEFASNEAAQQEAQHTHEKQMRMLELLASHMRSSKASSDGGSPLASVLARMPESVKLTLRDILGPLFDEMVVAVAHPDAEIRRAQLSACIERIEAAQKVAMGARIPAEWQTELLSAWTAKLAE